MITITAQSSDIKMLFEALAVVGIEGVVTINRDNTISGKLVDGSNALYGQATYTAARVTMPPEAADVQKFGISFEKIVKMLNLVQSPEVKIEIDGRKLTVKSDGGSTVRTQLIDPVTLRKAPENIPTNPYSYEFQDSTKIVTKKIKECLSYIPASGSKFKVLTDTTGRLGIYMDNGNEDDFEYLFSIGEVSRSRGPEPLPNGQMPAMAAFYMGDYIKELSGMTIKMSHTSFEFQQDYPIRIKCRNEPGTLTLLYIAAPMIPQETPDLPEPSLAASGNQPATRPAEG